MPIEAGQRLLKGERHLGESPEAELRRGALQLVGITPHLRQHTGVARLQLELEQLPTQAPEVLRRVTTDALAQLWRYLVQPIERLIPVGGIGRSERDGDGGAG